MSERTPQADDQPHETGMNRRKFLQSGIAGVAAMLLVPTEESVAAEPIPNGEAAGLLSRCYELGHTPVEYQAFKERNDDLEELAYSLEFLATLYLDETTSESMQEKILEKIHATLTAVLPQQGQAQHKDRSLLWKIMEQLHDLANEFGRAGYFLNYAPMVAGSEQQSDESSTIHSISFALSDLRFVQAVTQRTREEFWDEQPLTYNEVTLGPSVLAPNGKPIVPPKTHLARGQSGMDTIFDTVFIDPVLAKQSTIADTLPVLKERLRTDPNYLITANAPHETVLNMLRDAKPEEVPAFAAQRFIAMNREAVLAAKQDVVRRIERDGDDAHEASHIFFERLRRALGGWVYRAGDARSPHGAQFAMRERGVEAEIGGELGALLYNQEELPDEYRWIPIYNLCQSVHKKARDPVHGGAAEWILGELVKRVVAHPQDFGLNLMNVPQKDHELSVWAQLDAVSKAPRATLHAAWQDIAAAYRATLDQPFIKADNTVINRPIEAGRVAPMHPSWSELLGSAGTLAVGGLAWVIHRRMEADKQVRVGGKIVLPKPGNPNGGRKRT